MKNRIRGIIAESARLKQNILADEILINTLESASKTCVAAYRQDKKMLFCGNGGSAADAQHIAAELSGRFYTDRPPLYAEALHVNSSYLTAVANDYSYEEVYARMCRAAGRPGDILVGISTSGNSENVVRAMLAAKEQKMITIALTGSRGGKMRDLCDIWLPAPSDDTPRIQEAHILYGHILCQMIEEELFS